MKNYSDSENFDVAKESGFNKRLAAERKKKKWSQEDLAWKLQARPQTISNWESGRSTPSFGAMMKLADMFDCDLDYLTGRLQEKTHDIHYVHEITELSEEAINKILKEKSQTVSRFIENPVFSSFIRCYGEYCNLLNSLKSYEQYEKADDEIDVELDNGKRVKMPYSLALSLFEQRLTNSLIVLCQRAMGERISELFREKKEK